VYAFSCAGKKNLDSPLSTRRPQRWGRGGPACPPYLKAVQAPNRAHTRVRAVQRSLCFLP